MSRRRNARGGAGRERDVGGAGGRRTWVRGSWTGTMESRARGSKSDLQGDAFRVGPSREGETCRENSHVSAKKSIINAMNPKLEN